jgi:hypothetical protein
MLVRLTPKPLDQVGTKRNLRCALCKFFLVTNFSTTSIIWNGSLNFAIQQKNRIKSKNSHTRKQVSPQHAIPAQKFETRSIRFGAADESDRQTVAKAPQSNWIIMAPRQMMLWFWLSSCGEKIYENKKKTEKHIKIGVLSCQTVNVLGF